jgi:CSLREA domain-containing protein
MDRDPSRRASMVVLMVVVALLLPGRLGAASRPGSPAGTGTVGARSGVLVDLPGRASAGRSTAIRLLLPEAVAAVDGRVLVAKRAAELVGVAVYGGGTGLRPVAIPGGYAFGAYDLEPRGAALIVDLVLVPRRTGRLGVRVLVDAAADRDGGRVSVAAGAAGTIAVGSGHRVYPAPATGAAPGARRPAGPLREPLADGRMNARDTDTTRAAWEEARALHAVCHPSRPGDDANGDGCVDIVDVQAVRAAHGSRVPGPDPGRIARATGDGRTLVVTSGADSADGAPGDGACADERGRCTLRAAIAEAQALPGDDRILFDLPGSAPVTIALGGRLPYITSRSGALTINGYSQKGARVNSATVGSNAIPGVVLRGNGPAAREVGLYLTSAGNTVRGLALVGLWRGIVIDGPAATGNRIAGNWIGVDGTGSSQPFGNHGVLLNVGARGNVIGTPALEDRNVIANWDAAIDLYGPGTDGNVIQDNLLCMHPSGAAASCATGIDHNFGPKRGLIGGDATNERNVIGPTILQGIELSHGWDPGLPWGTDTALTYQVNENEIIGNWVGFRADGRYDPAYRSGQAFSTGDNGNGINVYDGTNDNLVARNHVASVYDGIQVMAPNATGNIVRGNTIGESPQGEPAPLSGWGIVVRWGSRFDELVGNTIRNAAQGGVGLLSTTNTGAAISVATNIRISRTIVTGTDGPAIRLAPVGSDPARSANDGILPPALSSATPTTITGTAVPGATVEVYRASGPAGRPGLPVQYLGSATAAGGGGWSLAVAGLSEGDRVTVLQVRSDANTSELAPNLAVGGGAAPPPTPAEVLARDEFGRTLDTGWGDADVGGRWAVSSGSFSVRDGQGRIVAGAGQSRQARLPVGAVDVRVEGHVTVDRLPVSGNAYAYVLARATTSRAYRGVIRIGPDGRVGVGIQRSVDGVEREMAPVVTAGLVVTPGQPIRFRFEAVGDRLRLWAWTGADAPTGPTAVASDGALGRAGGAGLLAYTGRTVRNGPLTFGLDALVVRTP